MRILGIDLGLKRTGLAVSDLNGIHIRHLPNLNARNQKEALELLHRLCSFEEVSKIVIGEPKSLTKESCAIAKRAASLAAALKDLFASKSMPVDVFLFNEEFTSKKAAQNLVLTDIPQKKRKKLLDSESAAILIEDFCHSIKAKM